MKRRIYLAAVLFVAIWPAVHFGLARSYRFDGWSFFGWAMYATPDRSIEIGVGRIEGGKLVPVTLPPELTARAQRFALERSTWGRLVRPDALAAQIGRELPTGDGLAIRVRELRIDPLSGAVSADDASYGYRPR